MYRKKKEEILEAVLRLKKAGKTSVGDILSDREGKIDEESLREIEKEGYISIEGKTIVLKEKGTEVGTRVLRCHRLAERLLYDILDLHETRHDTTACRFEHVLNPEVSESICTLLGHPRECPHGQEIPEGACCKRAQKEVSRIIVALSELKAGSRGKVAYLSTRRHSRLDKLSAMGIFPGAELRVHQTYPSYVIQIDETQVAVGDEVLDDIYVRKL